MIKKIPVPKIMLAHLFDLTILWIYRSKEVLLVTYWPTGKHLERGVHDFMEVPVQDLMDVYSTTEFYGGTRPELDQDDIHEFHGSTKPVLHGGITLGFYWGII